MYTIAEIAAELGVSVPTVRSWERRYELVMPTRTTGGHRRYSETDFDRLRVFAEIVRRQSAFAAATLLKELDKK